MNANNYLIPPGFSSEEWDDMLHKERIEELVKWSKSSQISCPDLLKIKEEILYYQNIKQQIRVLTK